MIVKEKAVCLVICDVNLPKESGFVLAEILGASRPEIPVLLMSAYHSKANLEKAQSVGAVAFLEKPFTIQQLVDHVEKCLPPLGNEFRDFGQTSGLTANPHFRTEDLVQIFCLNGRSVVIAVKSSLGAIGKIYLQRGAVHHAEWEGLSGDEAFHALLSLDLPELTIGEWDGPILQTVVTSWEKLLLIAAVEKDGAHLPSLSALR